MATRKKNKASAIAATPKQGSKKQATADLQLPPGSPLLRERPSESGLRPPPATQTREGELVELFWDLHSRLDIQQQDLQKWKHYKDTSTCAHAARMSTSQVLVV